MLAGDRFQVRQLPQDRPAERAGRGAVVEKADRLPAEVGETRHLARHRRPHLPRSGDQDAEVVVPPGYPGAHQAPFRRPPGTKQEEESKHVQGEDQAGVEFDLEEEDRRGRGQAGEKGDLEDEDRLVQVGELAGGGEEVVVLEEEEREHPPEEIDRGVRAQRGEPEVAEYPPDGVGQEEPDPVGVVADQIGEIESQEKADDVDGDVGSDNAFVHGAFLRSAFRGEKDFE